jgi:predicted transcriptional regulator
MKRMNTVGSRADMPPPSPDDVIRRFVERFAMLLADAGMPRMPARVFARLLAEDSGALTAAELAERLQVSPAAISGAVRYLTQVGMLLREREPGERRDRYRLHADVWTDMYRSRAALLRRWQEEAQEAAAALAGRPGGRRLAETSEFFAFLQAELPAAMDRWEARNKAAAPRTV